MAEKQEGQSNRIVLTDAQFQELKRLFESYLKVTAPGAPRELTTTEIEKNEEWIETPTKYITFNFKEKVSNINIELFRLIYDAQVKKMLAYIGLGISSFIPQMQIFFFILGNIRVIDLGTSLLIFLLALGFYGAQIFSIIAIVTKYQEIKVMEDKLRITIVHDKIFYRIRPIVTKVWDYVLRVIIGKGQTEEKLKEEERYRTLNRIISLLTLLVSVFVTIIFVYVAVILIGGLLKS